MLYSLSLNNMNINCQILSNEIDAHIYVEMNFVINIQIILITDDLIFSFKWNKFSYNI